MSIFNSGWVIIFVSNTVAADEGRSHGKIYFDMPVLLPSMIMMLMRGMIIERVKFFNLVRPKVY